MNQTLRILLLEDAASDAELAERALRDANIPCDVHRVEERDAFVRELEERPPDLVLSDYHLPGFDGLEALRIVRERLPDVPFIFLSGAIGEERAIETLTSGATDYVLKDRMARLVPAVRRAIDEADLRREQQRLAREIIDIPVREQARIGRDLHDVVGQNLTATMFMIKTLETKLRKAGRPEAEEAGRLSQQVRESIQQVRQLVRGLQPVEPVGNGLMAALEDLCRNVAGLFNVRCDFRCDGEVILEDRRAATEMYRIAQEALNNAVKHSGADRIEMELARRNGALVMAVSDNGKGLPDEAARGKGMGLSVMKYRARQIGAELVVGAAPAGGVRVECCLLSPSRKTV
jgi:signal transduction histidine kinase